MYFECVLTTLFIF